MFSLRTSPFIFLMFIFAIEIHGGPISGICGFRPLFRSRSGFRIVGGRGVRAGEIPWQVYIRNLPGPSGIPPAPFCGGSVIDERWILTAAHCFFPPSPASKDGVELLRVVTGITSLSEDLKNSGSSTLQIRRPQEVILHEAFERQTMRNDIALVKLKTPLQINNVVQAICLPRENCSFEDRVCVASGWGIMDNGRRSAILRTVYLPIINHRRCQIYLRLRSRRFRIFSTSMCTMAPEGGRDTCTGDSGGPLACETGSGRMLLAGVVSWGPEKTCGKRSLPSIFTQVSNYTQWIREKTGLLL